MAGLHGERFDRLTHAYRCFLAGSCPSQSAAEVAGVVFSGVRGPAELPGHDSACARAGARCREGSAELTCVSVTLVGIVTSLTSEGQPAELVRYCRDTLAVLFQDLDLMTQLVHHFQTEDQIISHLAAKSVSTYVVHHLLESATVSPVWQQKCVQAFHSSSPGQELDGCLWSLTDVLKRLLQAAHQEILGKIVAAFEPSLRALCSKFLPEEKQRGMDFTSCDRWGTTFCLLLDLLEALAASSVICGAGLKSPRLVHIHSSALLTTISCSPEYFVKKRALLLLKRAVLQKAGEDWASGESVQVESASFFGGNKHSDGGQKPDCVMLRAVSLLILKSTELHIQAPGITAGVDSAPDVYGYLQSLWGFLRQCSVHLMEVKHLCSWVSLLFGEQDDDMMEAAKASLFIFLHHSWIATPLALSAGIRQRVHLKAQDNPILELYYTTQCRSPAQADIDGLSKKSYLSVRQVERWFRRRRNQDCPGVLKKFREACWRFVFYLLAFIGGIAALYDKEWFYDTREVWTGFPKQSMLESQYWYYVLEMSFYGSLLFSMSFDVKRKDFKEQIIHHLATLVLLSFSWCSNYIRVGTLVMLVHDASDVLLESAKLFNYAKWEKACNTLFVLFAIVFMVTRLIIFPFWLIHCTWVYPIHHYPAFFGYYFFNVMLMVLLCLHIFWAYLILCMIRKFMFSKMTRDERSENEEEEEEESNATEDEAAEEHKLGNGHAVHEKEDKNGCFGCLSPREDICRSKTVY
uniref:Ceramide synthase 3a n=1 Tax=Scophthalmus maximus TaxID=52904 RepID=A0A8D3AVY5_SCOMX